MKISFNTFRPYGNVTNRGLWSRSSRTSEIDNVMNIRKITYSCYYNPFSDETPEQIQRVIRENSSAKVERDNSGAPVCYINQCRAVQKCPFTEAEYDEYCEQRKCPTKITDRLQAINLFVSDKYIAPDGAPARNNAFFNENDPNYHSVLEISTAFRQLAYLKERQFRIARGL